MRKFLVLLSIAAAPAAQAYQEYPVPQTPPDIDIVCTDLTNPSSSRRFHIWSRDQLVRTLPENHTQRGQITDTQMTFIYWWSFTINRGTGDAKMFRTDGKISQDGRSEWHYKCARFDPTKRAF